MKEHNPIYEHLAAYRNGEKELPTYQELLDYGNFFSCETIAYNIIIKNLKTINKEKNAEYKLR